MTFSNNKQLLRRKIEARRKNIHKGLFLFSFLVNLFAAIYLLTTITGLLYFLRIDVELSPDYMDKRDRFLQLISQIESSGGRDLAHSVIDSGIHKGDRAVGRYGLMPNTVETLNNIKKRDQQFGPDENITSQLNNDELDEFVQSNPRVEDNYANQLADYVLNKTDGDMEKAAFLWNQGQYTPKEDLTPELMEQTDYVQKFNQIKEMMDKYAK